MMKTLKSNIAEKKTRADQESQKRSACIKSNRKFKPACLSMTLPKKTKTPTKKTEVVARVLTMMRLNFSAKISPSISLRCRTSIRSKSRRRMTSLIPKVGTSKPLALTPM